MIEGRRLLRVVLQDVGNQDRELRIDLIFRGLEIEKKIEYFGLWQDKKEREKAPFTLRDSGEVDFGSAYDGDDRFYNFNIFSREVKVGELFTAEHKNEETVFKVVKIAALIE